MEALSVIRHMDVHPQSELTGYPASNRTNPHIQQVKLSSPSVASSARVVSHHAYGPPIQDMVIDQHSVEMLLYLTTHGNARLLEHLTRNSSEHVDLYA